MKSSSTIAKEISDYLMTGMHHSTPEGQKAIEKIISQNEDSQFIDSGYAESQNKIILRRLA